MKKSNPETDPDRGTDSLINPDKKTGDKMSVYPCLSPSWTPGSAASEAVRETLSECLRTETKIFLQHDTAAAFYISHSADAMTYSKSGVLIAPDF